MDHFGPGIELLDINVEGENVVNFTCFTEKAVSTAEDGKPTLALSYFDKLANKNLATVLKKPLHTSIAVEMDEFDDIKLPEQHHVVLSVKDFRNILQHAQLTSGELAASYSDSGRPMRLSYNSDGVTCKFILMTVLKDALTGQRGKKAARGNQARPQLEAAAPSASYRANSAAAEGSRLPAEPLRTNAPAQQRTPVRPQRQSQFQIRPPPLPPASTLRSYSLFVTQDNDDQVWEPVNPEDEEDAEDIARLEWDPNHVSRDKLLLAVKQTLMLRLEPISQGYSQLHCCRTTGRPAPGGHGQDVPVRPRTNTATVSSPPLWTLFAVVDGYRRQELMCLGWEDVLLNRRLAVFACMIPGGSHLVGTL